MTLDTSATPQAGLQRVRGNAFSASDIDKLRHAFDEFAGVSAMPVGGPRKKRMPAQATVAGAAIIRLRARADLTQQELAELLKTDQANIARMETGRAAPGTRMLERIAKVTEHELAIDFRPLPDPDDAE